MNKDVTVILSGYRRPQNLKLQMEALDGQTVRPTNIFYWHTNYPGLEYDFQTIQNRCISGYASHNFGVWGRFTYALNARTNYVCVIDDDTIPGSHWLENCINTYEKHPGVLSTVGIVFDIPKESDELTFKWLTRIGWDRPNLIPEQVDMGCHSWFFHRDILSSFWREIPPLGFSYNVGEDMHISYTLQKYTPYKTWIPPHPPDRKELWGSLRAWELGCTPEAVSSNGENHRKMAEYLLYLRKKGFSLMANQEDFNREYYNKYI